MSGRSQAPPRTEENVSPIVPIALVVAGAAVGFSILQYISHKKELRRVRYDCSDWEKRLQDERNDHEREMRKMRDEYEEKHRALYTMFYNADEANRKAEETQRKCHEKMKWKASRVKNVDANA